MYSPHVLAVETGQPVFVKNSDPFLRKHPPLLALDNPSFNFAQVMTGQKKLEPFTAAKPSNSSATFTRR